MTVHIILLIYVSFLGCLIFGKKPYRKSANVLFVSLSFFAIFVIQALRNESVGDDTSTYVNTFNMLQYGVYYRTWEPLFELLAKSIARITTNPQVFLGSCSFLILFGIGCFLCLNISSDESVFWSVFLFIVLTQYFTSMNLLRQSLALSVGCNIYTVMNKDCSGKRWFKCLVLLIISSMFHRTGILCALLILPFLIHIDKKRVLLSFVIVILAYYAYPLVMQVFFRFFPQYSRYIGGVYDQAISSGYYYLIALIEITMVVLYLVFIDPNKPENQHSYILLVIIMFSFLLIVMQRRISLAVRLGYYFEIFILLLIPEFLSKWKNAKMRLFFKSFFYLSGWVYYIYSMTVSSARGCVPYTFFWQ